MRMMMIVALTTVAAVLSAFSATAEGRRAGDGVVFQYGGEQIVNFRDWQASCQLRGVCRAQTFSGVSGVSGVSRGGAVDYMITVASSGRRGEVVIQLTAVAAYVAPSSSITVDVDGRRIATLKPNERSGWISELEVINEYILRPNNGATTILPAMMRGQQMAVSFRDARGVRRTARFSLLGLTASLDWMDRGGF